MLKGNYFCQDFESERKWKLSQAKKVALKASKGLLDHAIRGEKKLKVRLHPTNSGSIVNRDLNLLYSMKQLCQFSFGLIKMSYLYFLFIVN